MIRVWMGVSASVGLGVRALALVVAWSIPRVWWEVVGRVRRRVYFLVGWMPGRGMMSSKWVGSIAVVFVGFGGWWEVPGSVLGMVV